MNKQKLLAIAIAPLVAPLLYQLGLIFLEYNSVPSVSLLLTDAFLPLLLIALPVSYGATIFIGLPLIWFLKHISKLNFFSVTLCSSLFGAGIMVMIYGSISLKYDGWEILFWYPVYGGLMGFTVAAAYCRISGIPVFRKE